jgi:hypothetical protein
MKQTIQHLIILVLLINSSCKQTDRCSKKLSTDNWKTQLSDQLPLLGHRNWILIVDKAFPSQNAAGIVTINTDEALLPVLSYTLGQIALSEHVKPNIFTDAELNFISEKQVPEIEKFRTQLFEILQGNNVQTILHDSVFVQIDKASQLFKVIILKTDQLIPYSSTFIQLDCKYWNAGNEKKLRESIKNNSIKN